MTFSPKLNILPPSQRALWNELKATPKHFVLYKRANGEWFSLAEEDVLKVRQMIFRLIKGYVEDFGLQPG